MDAAEQPDADAHSEKGSDKKSSDKKPSDKKPSKKLLNTCIYQGCKELCLPEKTVCFWHDPDADKSGDDIKDRLEKMAREGKSLAGFRLARANLENIDLGGREGCGGPDMSNIDLYRANLRHAHLFRTNLHGARLLKTDLSGATLNFANMSEANMLGIRLDYCRMAHVEWGRTLYQERQLSQKQIKRTADQKHILFGEAEEVCRNVRKSCEAHGLFDESGYFFYKEMVFRRYQYPLGSWQRWMSKIVDMLCGYGEKPLRVFAFSTVLVTLCALFYFLSGMISGGNIIRFEPSSSLSANIDALLDSLYFSMVTFTTLGYGDITPMGPSRTLASLEAFIGNFCLALFVVVFVKKMTR
ncbi:ion channel [Parendozoicomonas sp. Alg238-R29]|uniref:ion channel n=1 Tax=Parendozoicomonas sp. Alg238-R29 TaxID=2993446 RepID=UPI00248EC9B4|nr:ion channel [Parendozoicomonas sp. Alg238-R29]